MRNHLMSRRGAAAIATLGALGLLAGCSSSSSSTTPLAPASSAAAPTAAAVAPVASAPAATSGATFSGDLKGHIEVNLCTDATPPIASVNYVVDGDSGVYLGTVSVKGAGFLGPGGGAFGPATGSPKPTLGADGKSFSLDGATSVDPINHKTIIFAGSISCP